MVLGFPQKYGGVQILESPRSLNNPFKTGFRDVSESADPGRLRASYGDRCTFTCLSEH